MERRKEGRKEGRKSKKEVTQRRKEVKEGSHRRNGRKE